MAFDVNGALGEGYSLQEIADHLGKQKKFNVEEARKEGYSDSEIIHHLNAAASAPNTGFLANVNAGWQNLKGDIGALGAVAGVPGAEKYAADQRKKAEETASIADISEHPWEYVKGLAGRSLPYMAAPLVAGLAAPEVAVGTLGGAAISAADLAAGAVSAGQFAGSNVTRQLEEGKAVKDVNVAGALAAAPVQAALDVVGFRFLPGIRGIFSKAGVPISEKTATDIVSKYIAPVLKTAGAEGATEAAQQVLERAQAGLNIADPEARKEYFDSFVGGAVLGGAIHPIGSMFEGKPNQAPPPPAPAPTMEGVAPAPTPAGLPDTYEQAVQEVERLKQAQQTEEVKARIAQLEAYKNRLVRDEVEGHRRQPNVEPTSLADQIQNQSVTQGEFRETMDLPTREVPAEPTKVAPEKEMPTVLDSNTLGTTGLSKQSGIYKQLLGKDLTNLEDLDAVTQLAQQAQGNSRLSQETKQALDSIVTQAHAIYGKQAEMFGPKGKVLEPVDQEKKLTPVQKKIAELTAGKDLTDPAQIEEIRAILTDYANAKNRSQSAISQVDEFLKTLPSSTPEATNVLKPTEPVADTTEPSPAVVSKRRKASTAGTEGTITTGLGATPAVSGEPAVGETVSPDTLSPEEQAGLQDELQSSMQGDMFAQPTTEPVAAEPAAVEPTPAMAETEPVVPAAEPAAPAATVEKPASIKVAKGRLSSTAAINELVNKGGYTRSEATQHVNDTQDINNTVSAKDIRAMYRTGDKGKKGIAASRVQRVVDSIISRWKNAPPIKVVQSVSELPEALQAQIIQDKVKPPGAFDPNTGDVYLISDNIVDEYDASLTLMHEVMGHYGLRGVLSNTYAKVMDDIYNGNITIRKQALKKMAQGLDKHTAVEEVLAEMAEKGVYNNGIQRVMNAIRQFLRSVGIKFEKVTDNEIRALLANANRFVYSGEKLQENAAAPAFKGRPLWRDTTDAFDKWFGNSVVRNPNGTPKVMYHGTARDIHAFKPKQAGAIFLTDDPKFAESFTDASEDYMVKHAAEFFTPEELAKFTKEAKKIAKREGTSLGDEYEALVRSNLPSRANVVPVYASAQKPFDYENPTHVKALVDELNSNPKYNRFLKPDEARYGDRNAEHIARGHWSSIEADRVQDAIKALGFDGFHIIEGGRKNLAVYEPSQIKSVFNRGTYDRNDNRILYRTRKEDLTPEGQNAAALLERMKGISNPRADGADTLAKGMAGVHHFFTRKEGPSATTLLRRAIADKDASVNEKLEASFNNKLIDSVGNVRADLLVDQAQDVAGHAENYMDNGGIKINEYGLVQTYKKEGAPTMKSIVDKLHALGDKLGSKSLAVQVAHNALIANRANEINIHNAKVQTQIDAALAKKNTKAAEALEKTKVTIRASQAEIDAGLEAMRTYPEIKTILDEFTEYKNGLVDFLQKCGRINEETARNWKENAGYVPWTRLEEEVDLFDQAPVTYKSGLINISQLPKLDREGSSKEIANVFDNMIGLTNWAIKTGMKTRAANAMAEQLPDAVELKTDDELKREQKNNRDRVIYTYKNGERTAYLLGSAIDMSAFSSNIETLGPIMQAFKFTGDFLRSAITHMPAFAVSQLIQDGTYRGMMLSGVEKPFSIPPKVFKNFGKALRGELSEIQALGITGVYDGMPEHMMERAQVRYGLKERASAKKAWDKLEKFSLAADLAVRAAIYEQTIEETKSATMPEGDQRLALYRAKEYINFKRAGASPTIRTMRHIVPFMNAYIQGMDVLFRTMQGKGISLQEKRKAQQLFFATGLKMMALSAVYTMLASGDDDYEGLEDYERDRNYIIPGTGIKIPVAPELGFMFKVIPERILRYIVSQGTERPQDAETFYKGFRDAFITAYGSPGVTPQLVKPGLEVMVNYSFFTGNPIVGQSMKNVDPSLQFNAGTSEFAKLFGMVGLSPMKVDYLIRGYTGMAGAIALDLTDAVANPDRMSKPINKLSQVSTFMYDASGRGYKSDFYKFRESVDEVVDTVNLFKREGRAEELQEYLTDDKLRMYAMQGVANKIEGQLAKIRQYRNIVTNDPQLSGDEKRQIVDDLQAQEKELILAYNVPQLRKMAKE